jgi:protein-S-isoprenylcysteine O-methyltransferase Ste14
MFLFDYKPPKQLRALFIAHYAPILLTIMIGPLTAIYNIWELPTDRGITIIVGLLVFLFGTIFYFRWEFFWHRTYHGQLVTDGVFRYIRHPHYTSLIIIEFGLALFFYSQAGILIAVFSIPLLIWSIYDEEKLLVKQYGAAYKQYMADVPWRIIPRIF